MVLDHYRVPTAPFAVLHANGTNGLELTSTEMDEMIQRSRHAKALSHYPLFAKPLAEHSSKGILDSSKIRSPDKLYPALRALRSSCPSSHGVLIETYLSGREFTVGILGTGEDAWVLGVIEIVFTSKGFGQENVDDYHSLVQFTTEKSKTEDDWDGIAREVKVDRGDPEVELACQGAMRAWQVLCCRDGGRVDLRIDHSIGHPVANVMEVSHRWLLHA